MKNNSRIGMARALVALYADQARALGRLAFGPTVACVYNPLIYAREPFVRYLSRYGDGVGKTVFLGMNPGPWGMLQTGIPFGEVEAVRDWLGISGKVGQPEHPHHKRPVLGFACARREISGKRLWGLFRSRFASAEDFFKEHLVLNYCPLAFFDAGGANLTPDKLPKKDREPLLALCDTYLYRVLSLLKPRFAVGIGGFAEGCLRRVVEGAESAAVRRIKIVRILHPSPASPAANKGWEAEATRKLKKEGVWRG